MKSKWRRLLDESRIAECLPFAVDVTPVGTAKTALARKRTGHV